MKLFQKLLAAGMALTMLLAMTACGGSKGTLVMATNATFPPYEFIEDGKIVGIDAEMAAAIAEKLNMTLEIEDVEFGSIVGGVASGKYDIGVAGMTVDPDRLESVNFSESYATGVQVVIVKEDSAIQSLGDLEGKKIGVQQDTTGDIYSTDDFGEENIVRYNKGADAVQALVSDKIDCVIIDNEPAKSFVQNNAGLKILDSEYAVEDYAIAIAKDNDELLKKVNDALAELKAEGKLQEIIDKYIPAE